MSSRFSRRNLLPGFVAAALFTQNLDSTVITTALPPRRGAKCPAAAAASVG